MVIEMPTPSSFRPTGTIDYQYILVKGDIKEDIWVKEAEMRPSNNAVLHHGKVWVRPPGSHWMEHAIARRSLFRRDGQEQRRMKATTLSASSIPAWARRLSTIRRLREADSQRFGLCVRTALHRDRQAHHGHLARWAGAGEGAAQDALLHFPGHARGIRIW